MPRTRPMPAFDPATMPAPGVRVLPPALLPLTIVLAAARARISSWGVRTALENKAEEVVASDVRDTNIGRGLARHETALRLTAQHRPQIFAEAHP